MELHEGMKIRAKRTIHTLYQPPITEGEIGQVHEVSQVDREITSPYNLFGKFIVWFDNGWVDVFTSTFDMLFEVVNED